MEIFGESEDESAFDHSADQDNSNEIEELKKESEALRKIRQSVGTEDFPRMLFDKVFHADIVRLRSMEDMWKSKKPPEPLDFSALMAASSEAMKSKDSILGDGQRVWTLEENLVVFNDSLARLSERVVRMRKNAEGGGGPEPIISFDKDDEDTLDFVAASANIRSTIFGIDRKSKFDIKQMAGNIIPAIATTNAIVAGLCVLEAFKVLKGQYDRTREVRSRMSAMAHHARLTNLLNIGDSYSVPTRSAAFVGQTSPAQSRLPCLQRIPDERICGPLTCNIE